MSEIANRHYAKASVLYKQGKADDAIAELDKAIALEPGHVNSYIALGGIYEAHKDYDQALAMYGRILKFDDDNVWANLRLGSLLNQIGRPEEAVPPLWTAWHADTNSAQTANTLALALHGAGDTDAAQDMYEEALKLNPDLAEARFNLATLRFNDQKYKSAIAQYTTYMLKAGDTAPAHRNIGMCFIQLGQVNAAIHSFEKAIALDRDDPTTFLHLGIAHTLNNDLVSAVDTYDRALRIDPSFIEARYNLAKVLRLQGKSDEAIGEFQKVIAYYPDHYRAMNGIATCYLDLNDNRRAAEYLRKAIAIAPEFDLAHYNLAIAMQKMNQLIQARFHFKEAQRLNPTGQVHPEDADQVMPRPTEHHNRIKAVVS